MKRRVEGQAVANTRRVSGQHNSRRFKNRLKRRESKTGLFGGWWWVAAEKRNRKRRREIESEMKAKGKRISGLPIALKTTEKKTPAPPRRAFWGVVRDVSP